jgi:DNA-binding MarR family transcriptional regulator
MNQNETANDSGALNLDNQLCFALYVCSKEIIRRYKPVLEPFGLTYTGYITMMALWEKDDIAVKVLGERLSLDSGTLTPLLKKLENHGFVKRGHKNGDDRTVYITLTQTGKKLKSKCEQIPVKMMCACNLDAASAQSMLKNLHRMIANISDPESEREKD